jgi:hypothetical protein
MITGTTNYDDVAKSAAICAAVITKPTIRKVTNVRMQHD